jgi:hypothetical protein
MKCISIRPFRNRHERPLSEWIPGLGFEKSVPKITDIVIIAQSPTPTFLA